MKTVVLYAALTVWLALVSVGCRKQTPPGPPQVAAGAQVQPVAQTRPFYAFEVENMDGGATTLGDFQGKVLLVINVASKCGFTKQYAGLQALYEKYGPQGLVVVGFPANNFGGQEPGTNDQIRQFCSGTYGVTFPVFAKISVKGDDIHPLYRFLTSPETNPQFPGDIKWNFNKFLVSREGDVIGRYESKVEPFDAQLVAEIENALKGAEG